MAAKAFSSSVTSVARLLLLLLVVASLTVSASPVPVAGTEEAREIRAKRYVVSVPPAAVNLTGWVPAVVPLGQALFSSRPYIIG